MSVQSAPTPAATPAPTAAPAAAPDISTPAAASAPGAAAPAAGSVDAPAASGASADLATGAVDSEAPSPDSGTSPYSWESWSPGADVPAEFSEAVDAISKHFEKQVKEAKDEADFYRNLFTDGSASDADASFSDLRDAKAKLEELQSQTSGWTEEKARLQQEIEAATAEIAKAKELAESSGAAAKEEFEAARQQYEEKVFAEYDALQKKDVDAFFEEHADDLKDTAIVEAMSAYVEADVPLAHALALAKLSPAEQKQAKDLLAAKTSPGSVLRLVRVQGSLTVKETPATQLAGVANRTLESAGESVPSNDKPTPVKGRSKPYQAVRDLFQW